MPAETISNIEYAPPFPVDTQGNLLDLYLPERTEAGPVPLFIWTSGSAWLSDDGKVGADIWADQLNPAGIAVAGVSIRSSSQVQFPGQLHDIKSAIRFLRHHASDYGLDPGRFAIAGNSSGGWTAAMAGVTGKVDEDLEGTAGITGVSSRVQAVVSFYGPTSLLLMGSQEPSDIVHDSPTSPESLLVGCPPRTCPELMERASPLHYVSADDPPFLIFHGTADELVPHGQSRVLYEKLHGNGNDVRFHSVPGIGHAHSYMEDASHAQDQTVFTSTGGVESVSQGFDGGTRPGYAYIIAFLRDAFASLRRGR